MNVTEEGVIIIFFSFMSNYWRKLLLPTATIAIITVFVFIPRKQATDDAIVISEPIPSPSNEILQEKNEVEQEQVEEKMPARIVVDVKGAVAHPGVYTLEEGDRLGDAISAAGGYVAEADSRMLNHAQKLTDELLIYVPKEGETFDANEMVALTNQQATATASTDTSEKKVNLNTADEGELTTLPGIGPAKAQAIIQYRTDQGLFKSSEALMEVSGIGQKTFENLEDFITID